MSSLNIAYLVASVLGGLLIGTEGRERGWPVLRSFMAYIVYASVLFLIRSGA